MQLGSIYLYPNKTNAYTNFDDWITERYRQVYQRNFKIYRGIDNKLEWQVKNSDQKPKSISGLSFVFSLISFDNQELIVEKDCNIDSVSNGRINVIIKDLEMLDLEIGSYRYSIRFERREIINQTESYRVLETGPLYIDSQYGALGHIEVVGDVRGNLIPSQEIREFSSYVKPWRDEDSFVSSIIDTNSQLVTAKTLHTLQFYFNRYTGRVIVQGSLDQGGNPQTWNDLQLLDYIDVEKEYVNIVGKYNWLRVRHIPNVPGLIGSFDVQQTIFFYYEVSINQPGKGYAVGNTILIKGNRLGGETPTNDLVITVTGTDLEGGITAITWTGSSYNGTTIYTVGGNSIPNTGTFDKILYR
jgi:hypothetical protein